jgi:SAM-dependent methyltransferase
MTTIARITRRIQDRPNINDYTRFHAPRYAVCLTLVQAHLPPPGPGNDTRQRVLDVGRSDLTQMLHVHLGLPVDSLGFEADGENRSGRHFCFDLNHAQSPQTWRTNDLPRYDAIVLAEVIEHLYTSPSLVLRYLRTLLKPGGILIVQTPNAASLTRRVRLLLGLHPYDKIAEDITSPNHFREYTRREMTAYALAAGFGVAHAGYYNYFDLRYGYHAAVRTGSRAPRWAQSIKYVLFGALPGVLKPGMTLVLRRPGNSEDGEGEEEAAAAAC